MNKQIYSNNKTNTHPYTPTYTDTTGHKYTEREILTQKRHTHRHNYTDIQLDTQINMKKS